MDMSLQWQPSVPSLAQFFSHSHYKDHGQKERVYGFPFSKIWTYPFCFQVLAIRQRNANLVRFRWLYSKEAEKNLQTTGKTFFSASFSSQTDEPHTKFLPHLSSIWPVIFTLIIQPKQLFIIPAVYCFIVSCIRMNYYVNFQTSLVNG